MVSTTTSPTERSRILFTAAAAPSRAGFGARAAPLTKYLGPKHYGVKLSDDDFRRMTLWLDANSEFYGAYEQTAAQARGEIVRPSLE